MLELRKILFPTDFSARSQRALSTALELTERFGAELHLLHAIVLHAEDPSDPAHHFPDPAELSSRLEEIAESRLAASLPDRPSPARVVLERRRGVSIAPVILEHADEMNADLIVMSTHGRRGLEHILLGSVTEEVVRRAACPVLTVRTETPAAPAPAGRRVLVPVDFSEPSRGALRLARELAATVEGELHLLHVFERPVQPEIGVAGLWLDAPDFPTVRDSLREALETFAREAEGPDVPVTYHVTEGRAVAGILDFAEREDTDLVVIATHGLTGMAHVLLGSVTERVVRRASCPVLTVRASDSRHPA
ncbi:MAG: universal stress protein [Gemmatimonadota bacterium]|nr:universal stress protein [Gemmatimonadota bacterium]